VNRAATACPAARSLAASAFIRVSLPLRGPLAEWAAFLTGVRGGEFDVAVDGV